MEGRSLLGTSTKYFNLYCFGFIILYAVYAFFGNNPRKANATIEYLESPNYPDFILVIVGLIILSAMIIGLKQNRWSIANFGFRLGKPFWIVLAIGILLFVNITSRHQQIFTFNLFFQLIPIFFFVVGSDIILRALFIDRIESALGRFNKNIF